MEGWPHPAEWLKRTDGHDWVCYSIAGYHRIFDTLGEYYLPCLSYPSNTIWTYNPFGDAQVQKALGAFDRLISSPGGPSDDCLPTYLYLIQRL